MGVTISLLFFLLASPVSGMGNETQVSYGMRRRNTVECGRGMTVNYVGSVMDSQVEGILGSWEDGCNQCGQYLERHRQICSGWYCTKDLLRTGIWLKRDPDQRSCHLGCPAYRDSATCGWTTNYACPGAPRRGARGYASDDGSQGWNCCCSCSGSIETAGHWSQKAIYAVGRAQRSCATFSNSCSSDISAARLAFQNVNTFSATAHYICNYQAQTCVMDANKIVNVVLTVFPQIETLLEHCLHGGADAKWWCPGDIMNLVHTAQAIQTAVSTTKYDCGFGGSRPRAANTVSPDANLSSAALLIQV